MRLHIAPRASILSSPSARSNSPLSACVRRNSLGGQALKFLDQITRLVAGIMLVTCATTGREPPLPRAAHPKQESNLGGPANSCSFEPDDETFERSVPLKRRTLFPGGSTWQVRHTRCEEQGSLSTP